MEYAGFAFDAQVNVQIRLLGHVAHQRFRLMGVEIVDDEMPLEDVGISVNGALDVRKEWLQGMTRIGVTAGASAPETLVQELLGRLRDLGAEDVQELHGLSENVSFNLPQALRS